jgi:hypothetical protein
MGEMLRREAAERLSAAVAVASFVLCIACRDCRDLVPQVHRRDKPGERKGLAARPAVRHGKLTMRNAARQNGRNHTGKT